MSGGSAASGAVRCARRSRSVPLVGRSRLGLVEAASDAVAALVEHAGVLGRIAAASAGRTHGYRAIRSRAGTARQASVLDDLRGRPLRELLERAGASLGVAAPPGLDDEVAAVEAELADPGPWLAYTPADACPDNNAVTERGMRLFDFGYGHLGHIALDAAYTVIPFPTCWCYAPLDDGIRQRMLATFRDELRGRIAPADDDAEFARAVSWSLAAWAVGFIALVADREMTRLRQRGPLHARESIVAMLEAIAARTGERHPAVSDVAGQLGATLRSRWLVGTIPTYPALR